MISNAIYPTPLRGTIVRQEGATFDAERTGLGRAKEIYRGYYDDFVSGVPLTLANSGKVTYLTYGTPHPFFPSLRLLTAPVKRGKGIFNGYVECEYRGLAPAFSNPPPPVYTLERTTGNEPLVTHPKWETGDIAGTADEPKNGAQWISVTTFSDKTTVTDYNPTTITGMTGPGPNYNPACAVFNQWLGKDPATGKVSIFAGRDNYRVAGSIFLKTYTSFSMPSDLSAVGTFSNPDGPAPKPADGYAWFFLGESSTDEVGIFRNQASWELVQTDAGTQILYGN